MPRPWRVGDDHRSAAALLRRMVHESDEQVADFLDYLRYASSFTDYRQLQHRGILTPRWYWLLVLLLLCSAWCGVGIAVVEVVLRIMAGIGQ